MSIRIERVQVKPGGPLEQSIDWSCGDLTLAYGPNETGKSYVVEFLVKCLFRTGARSGSGWNLRDMGGGGGVTVSGLEDQPVKMSISKRPKIDETWDADPRGLPQDLCRLLVVSQGNTRLSTAETADGIETDMLREFFSGEHLIESIRNNRALPKSAASASLESGTISGSGQWSDKGERERILAEIGSTQDLVDRFNDQVSHGAIAALTASRDQLAEQLEQLQAGRQYRANQLDSQLTSSTDQLEALPSTETIESVSADLRSLRRARATVETKQERQHELAGQRDDLEWTVSALDHYDRIISARPESSPSRGLAIASAAVAAVAVVAGLFAQRLALGLLAVVAGGLAAAHLWRTRNPPAPEPDDPVELERIATEFQRRFHQPLGDRASLEQKIEALKKLGSEAEVLGEQLGVETTEIRHETDRIRRLLSGWKNEDVSEDEWDSHIESLRRERQQLDQRVRETRSELDRLGLSPDGKDAPSPETPWDPDHFQHLTEQHRQAVADLDDEIHDQSQLLEEAHRSVGDTVAPDWESLLAALEHVLADRRRDYRNVTARMIAQVAVHRVLDDVADEEARMIQDGLEGAVIRESIRLMCPRYVALRFTEDGLVVVDDDDDEFPVKDLSTGAREQVFLGSRLGFARLALDGHPAFLVLDDAFQHSDWSRREWLVQQVVTLVEAGWQVLYFTMDDHIRDVFDSAGQQLGDRYVSLSLPQPTPPNGH